jgi:hypothetical protein
MSRYCLSRVCLLGLGIWSSALQATTPLHPIFERDWIAGSTTAMGITGDLRMTPDSITFDRRITYKLRFIEEKVSKQPETYWKDIPSFSLYEVIDPRPQTILRGNSLCGSLDKPASARYLAIGQDTVSERLTVIAYETKTPPADISLHIKGTCGSFGYFLNMAAKK